MDTVDSLILLLHIVGGALLAVNAPLMQLVVGPALACITAGEEKESAVAILQRRAHRTIDGVIVVMTLTALYLLVTRFDMIASSGLLMVKVVAGGSALLVANFLHFYLRGKRRKLKEQGKDGAALGRLSLRLEKVVLVGAPLAFLLAVIFNHW